MAESSIAVKPVRHPDVWRHDEDDSMPMRRVHSGVGRVGSSVARRLLVSYGVSAAGVVVQESGGLSLAAGEGLPLPRGQSKIKIDETSVLHDTLTRKMPTVIADASGDKRYQNDPLVEAPLGLRFIVRAPLLTKDNTRVGTLFLADQEPRDSFNMFREGKELMDAAARISEMITMDVTSEDGSE